MTVRITRSGLRCLDLFVDIASQIPGNTMHNEEYAIVIDAQPTRWIKSIVITAKNLLKDDIEKGRIGRVEIPMSGKNDKGTFKMLKEDLGLKADSTFDEVLERYHDKYSDNPEEILEQLDFFSASGPKRFKTYSLPSVLKPDLYEVHKRPFYLGKQVVKTEISLHLMILALSGYVISRVARIRRNKKYYSAFLFPRFGERSKFIQDRLAVFQNVKEARIPAFWPEEGLILWLACKIGKVADNQLVMMLMSDPAGSSPAALQLLKSYTLTREVERISELKKEEREKLESLIEDALLVANSKAGMAPEASYILKKLYLALTNRSALSDLTYEVSRKLIEAKKSKKRDKKRENIYGSAVTISRLLMELD